jgi:hypothetical protein
MSPRSLPDIACELTDQWTGSAGAAGRLARLTTSDVQHAGAQDAQGLRPLKVRMLLDFAAPRLRTWLA